MGVVVPQLAPASEDRASGAQVVDGSLKFNSASSNYLNRTPGSAGNRKTWTWSGWVKRCAFGSVDNCLFSAYGNGTQSAGIYFSNDTQADSLEVRFGPYSGGWQGYLVTAQVFRDPSAWYHVVFAADTTQAIASDRLKLYVNGTQVTTFNSSAYPTQNADGFLNQAQEHQIGRLQGNTYYLDGYLAEINFIDGSALTPSSFGFTDSLTNTWRPKKYTGTYGTNGFYLPMDGNSPIGEDKSGRGNNWTPVNFGGSAAIDKAATLPVIKTTGGGKIASIGSATDNLSSNLKLAYSYAGNSIDSAPTGITTFQANGATFTKGVDGGPSFYTDVAPLYMTERANQHDYPRVTFSAGAFNFMHNQTGSGTMECWFYNGSFSGEATIMSNQGGSGEIGIGLNMVGNTTCNINLSKGTSGSTYNSGNATLPQNKWSHVAVTKQVSGSTCSIKLYVNGVLSASNTSIDATTLSNSNSTHSFWQHGPTIGNEDPAFNRGWVTAYIKDFRVYDTIKYTGDFIVGSVDPDILPDTPSGVAGGSALTKVTDGAVSFDGSGDWLSLPTSSDFTCSSGTNFTFEAFIYPTSVSDTTPFGIGNNAGFAYRIISGSPYLYIAASGGILNTGTIAANKWTHIAVTRNSGTLYSFINGVLVGSVANSGSFDGTQQNFIGAANLTGAGSPGYTFTGHISNTHWVNGTALYTSNFTPPSAPLTAVANTKLLCCQSTTSATAASVTPGTITANGNAGATNFNPFTTDINTVRGQETGYCTLNPLKTGSAYTLKNGNLSFTSSANWDGTCGTFLVSSGKWYYEVTRGAGTSCLLGWCVPENYNETTEPGDPANSSVWRYRDDGTKRNGEAGGQSYAATWTSVGDVVGCALDLDAGTIRFYKNGIDQGIAYSNLSGKVVSPVIGFYNCTSDTQVNFGQNPFKYAPPEGFKTLCLANLPRPTEAAVRPDKYFKTVLYTGDQNGQTINVGFEPSLIWGKQRNDTDRWFIADTVRGKKTTGYYLLSSHLTTADTNSAAPDGITDISSTGFTLGANSSNDDGGWSIEINQTGGSYVAYCWNAGGAAVSNSNGSITSQVSANQDAGFSIVTYRASNGSSIGHGLGKQPAFLIIKNRDTTGDWFVYHKNGNTGSDLTSAQGLNLNNTGTTFTSGSNTFITAKNSSTFTVGTSAIVQNGTDDFIAYCWAEIPGFSKFGSYIGTGVSPNYVHLGFRPALVIIKNAGTNGSPATTNNWLIQDSKRNTYNQINDALFPNTNGTEGSSSSNYGIDFLSNGFAVRTTGGYLTNSNNASEGHTIIYAAWAEAPTNNLFGGQANAR